MGILVSPLAANGQTPPAVGIFWYVNSYLVVDRSTLEQAERYGDCLTHAAGHYEKWLEWQGLGQQGFSRAGLPASIAYSEYDDWPRGRIVYELVHRLFVVYADRRLQTEGTVAAVRSAFGLEQVDAIVRSDAHYR